MTAQYMMGLKADDELDAAVGEPCECSNYWETAVNPYCASKEQMEGRE